MDQFSGFGWLVMAQFQFSTLATREGWKKAWRHFNNSIFLTEGLQSGSTTPMWYPNNSWIRNLIRYSLDYTKDYRSDILRIWRVSFYGSFLPSSCDQYVNNVMIGDTSLPSLHWARYLNVLKLPNVFVLGIRHSINRTINIVDHSAKLIIDYGLSSTHSKVFAWCARVICILLKTINNVAFGLIGLPTVCLAKLGDFIEPEIPDKFKNEDSDDDHNRTNSHGSSEDVADEAGSLLDQSRTQARTNSHDSSHTYGSLPSVILIDDDTEFDRTRANELLYGGNGTNTRISNMSREDEADSEIFEDRARWRSSDSFGRGSSFSWSGLLGFTFLGASRSSLDSIVAEDLEATNGNGQQRSDSNTSPSTT